MSDETYPIGVVCADSEFAEALQAAIKSHGFEAIQLTHPDELDEKGPLLGILVSAPIPPVAASEWAQKSNVSLWLDETTIPISDDVQVISEIFGIDPLHVSCEGKAIIAVHPEDAEEIIKTLKSNPLGKNASIIGEARKERAGKVFLKTSIGGHRIVDKPVGEPIPRVC